MVLLRHWSARLQKRKAYADDWMILVAFASVFALDGVGIWAIYNGLGKHTNELTPHELGVMQKLVVAANVCWLTGTVFNKLSVLWLYRRIFKTPTFLKWSMGLFIVVVAFGVSFFIVFMTQCHPVSYVWEPVSGGGCRDLKYQEFASVSVNIAIDLAIFILPLPVLWTLHMSTRKKIYVTIMISFGLITIAVMGWRIQATYESTRNPDFVYTLATVGLISGLELWLGIIVACMPTIPPVFQAYVQPAYQRLCCIYHSRQERIGGKGVTSPKPVPSHDVIQLNDPSREIFGGLGIRAGLSTEVSSIYRAHSMPMAPPRAFGCGLRSNKDGTLYVTFDDESRVQLAHRDSGGRRHHFQREELRAVARGIVVHHELGRQEEYV